MTYNGDPGTCEVPWKCLLKENSIPCFTPILKLIGGINS